ncbi:MAG: c-type cytochrome [Terriglobia bacterium]
MGEGYGVRGTNTGRKRAWKYEWTLVGGFGVFICALAALVGVALPGYPSRAQSNSSNSAAVERGQKQFASSCGFCHGTDATGGRGPDLVRSKLVADDSGGNLIGGVIRNGRPAKGMPAFTMTPQQISDIAAFLHARFNAAIHSRAMGGDYPLSRLLTGNAAEGKAFFDGAGGCSTCHSPTGDLAHVAKKYEPVALETRMLYPRGAATPTVTVTLPSGEQVEGKLEHLDEFSVALRDAAGWHRSFSRSQVRVEVHDPLSAHRALLGKLTQDDVHNLFAYLETLQ